MRERPILFSGPMVRAILEGRKTVTRRPIKPSMRSADIQFELQQEADGSWHPYHIFDESRFDRSGTEHPILCPYGQPGDRLWVRESTSEEVIGSQSVTRYTADGAISNHPWWYSKGACPSIHMPRWASRILLEITDVRVERLQDITYEQAMAEGIDAHPSGFFGNGCTTAAGAFHELWESINGAGSWDANPMVWAISFKRIQP